MHAYAHGMTRLRDPRGRAALVLAIGLLGLVAASHSNTEHRVSGSSPAAAVAIESVPTLLVTASDRPVLSLRMRLDEGQRSLWLMTVNAPAIAAPAWGESVRSSASVLSAGSVAQGLAGRGPPSSGES